MASSKVQGVTINLDVNANGVNEALKDINKQLGSTAKELKQVEKDLKFNPDSVVLLTQKQTLLTDAIDKTSQKLEQLTKLKKQADDSGSLDKNSKEYRSLERQIESTKKSLEVFQDEQKKTNDALDEGSKSVKDLSSNFSDLLSANLVSDAIIKSVEALANAFVKLGESMYESVRESGKFADDINTLAKQYNLSTKELQVYSRASELIDVDVNTIAKSMSKLTKNMTSTSSGVISAFKKLGIATKESDGSLRDSNEVFYEVIDALGKISNETEQDSLALEIFGRNASELGTLIGGGAEELDKFNQYLEDNNLLLSQEELDTLNSMNDSFDTLGSTFDALKDKIAVALAPIIQDVVEKLSQFLIDHKDDITQLIEDTITWLTGEDAQELYENLESLATDIIPSLLETFQELNEDGGAMHTFIGLINIALATATSLLETLQSILTLDLDRIFGSDAWGNFMEYGGGSISSGGFGTLQSGGFASGGITLNNNFNITNGSNIDESVVKGWTMTMVDQINERLGDLL